MTTDIKVTALVAISGAATVSSTLALTVEAYDRLDLSVPKKNGANDGSVKADVLPGDAKQVQLLMITASNFKAGVKYTVDGHDVALDSPHLYLGGSVSLLGALNKIKFTNPHTDEVGVTILVGRNAT